MRKIMFNDKYGLTAAVLAGTKTQTRRIINAMPKDPKIAYGLEDEAGYVHLLDGYTVVAESRFKFGEVVAVAQNYTEVYSYYRQHNENVCAVMNGRFGQYHAGWKNKMFIESLFMPHRIRIEKIRVERLQDISEEDCLAEGVIKYTNDEYTYIEDGKKVFRPNLGTPRMAYAELIDRICGKGTWEDNLLVFVYDFKLVKS